MPPGILNFGIRGSADDREGKPVKITGALLSGTGPRLLYHAYVLSFTVLSLSIVQIIPFRPSPSHSASKSRPFRF
jgi:hypothetical protein